MPPFICYDSECGPLLTEPRGGDEVKPGDIFQMSLPVTTPFRDVLQQPSDAYANKDYADCKGDRPIVVLNKTKRENFFEVCLMATFGESNVLSDTFPALLSMFTCDVFNLGSSEQLTERHIHTVPPWNIDKPQYIIALPTVVELPENARRWRSDDMAPGTGYYVDPDFGLKKLRQLCNENATALDGVLAKGPKKRAREQKEAMKILKDAQKEYSRSTKTGRSRHKAKARPGPATTHRGESYISKNIAIGPDNKPWRVV